MYGDVRFDRLAGGLALTIDTLPAYSESASVRRLRAPRSAVRPAPTYSSATAYL
jgi:hypothetical protein